MEIHEKIYLQYFDDEGHAEEEVSWNDSRIHETDVEYVISGHAPADGIVWIPISQGFPTQSDADEKGRVLCLHEDDGMASCIFDQVKYRTMPQYLGFPVIAWSRIPTFRFVPHDRNMNRP